MYHFLFVIIFLTGCTHPRADSWWPADHFKMMSECRLMCRNQVKSYSTIDGECACYIKKPKSQTE